MLNRKWSRGESNPELHDPCRRDTMPRSKPCGYQHGEAHAIWRCAERPPRCWPLGRVGETKPFSANLQRGERAAELRVVPGTVPGFPGLRGLPWDVTGTRDAGLIS